MDTALATAPAQTRQTWVPLAVSIAIPLELATVAAFSLRHDRGPVLFVAAAMDSLILCGGALWFLSRWAGGYANLGLTPRRWLRMLMLAAIPASLAGSLLGIPAVLRLRAVLLVGDSMAGAPPGGVAVHADALLDRLARRAGLRVLAGASQERVALGAAERTAFAGRPKKEHLIALERG